MFKFLALAALVGVALSTPSKIDQTLLSTLETKQAANVMVSFVGGNRKVVNAVEIRTFATRTERLTTLKASLEQHALESQKDVQAFLKNKSVDFKSFWINNKIYIRGADKDLVQALANFPEVVEVSQERIIEIEPELPPSKAAAPKQNDLEWGIIRVQAEEAWKVTNGSGVVVSTIDTGVRYTHEALRDQYRDDGYGWFDPYGSTETPNDQNGHGTHTMGTICGTHGVGVAPGAKWIACKGCTGSCSEAALIGCGEWTVCPTKADGSDPDCSKAPVLSSNSWGGSGGDLWYEDVTEAWIAGGIVPISSNGNSGTSCRTGGSPGDYRRVIGVGSTNVANELSYYSSVGPARNDGRIKPEISAPGEDVRSSVPDSDTSYGSKSGTSMACPHVAGVTALLLSIDSDMTFGQVRQALLNGADHDVSASGATCASLRDDEFPNNHFGWGIINAKMVIDNASKAMKK